MSQLPPLPTYSNAVSDFAADLRSLVFSSQEKTAAHFKVHRSTITRYESGKHAPPIGYLAGLARLLIEQRRSDSEADLPAQQQMLLDEVNKAIRYELLDTPFKSWAELCAVAGAHLAAQQTTSQSGPTASQPHQDGAGADARNAAAESQRSVISVRFDSRFFGKALRDWGDHIFQWSQAPEHVRSDWAGLLLHSLAAVVGRLTPRRVMIIGLSVLLSIITVKLTAPLFEWPLDEREMRRAACLRFGAATLLVPLLAVLIIPAEQQHLFSPESLKQRLRLAALKLTGALVGFWVFAMVSLGLALAWTYLSLPPLPGAVRAGLSLIPLLFSCAAARRIPLDRYKMFEGELRMHPADTLFLAVFVVAGPLAAWFVDAFYWFLSDQQIAPAALVAVVTGLAGWEYWKGKRSP